MMFRLEREASGDVVNSSNQARAPYDFMWRSWIDPDRPTSNMDMPV